MGSNRGFPSSPLRAQYMSLLHAVPQKCLKLSKSVSLFFQSVLKVSDLPLGVFRAFVYWLVGAFAFNVLAVSSVPGASVQFSQRSVAGALVRDAGPLLEPRVPPLVQWCAAPGP